MSTKLFLPGTKLEVTRGATVLNIAKGDRLTVSTVTTKREANVPLLSVTVTTSWGRQLEMWSAVEGDGDNARLADRPFLASACLRVRRLVA